MPFWAWLWISFCVLFVAIYFALDWALSRSRVFRLIFWTIVPALIAIVFAWEFVAFDDQVVRWTSPLVFLITFRAIGINLTALFFRARINEREGPRLLK